MTKNNKVENKSTKLFFDLAKRSFEASWKYMQKYYAGNMSEFVDDPDFMSPFILNVIDYISNNFEKFTTQEGDCGDISEVDIEHVAVMLVWYSNSFRK
ncbi:hypothetical protein CWC46_21155 [Prodigiosinella confusarubida]|uniref:Uncharacterized protein n=1 Tax=Serratia sp. (strain ATCC 39006) TaxID=104623 RepID=A0A2I5TPB1_SERS3|nr:hypothetical protein [Serratia sp. ATCC 39006]AUH02079.1 hypothetical protein CWC46_21155 [Serratia sp. ATCC 39006]AUH06400.1 hypothetical protein Ser39006_021150 [Serratia sp. ATCC 39006]